MTAKRPAGLLAALVIAVALALAGCGGGGDGTSTQATDSTATTGTDATTTAPQGTSTQGAKGGNDQSQNGGGTPPPPSAPADTSNLPEPTEGSKNAAPGVPVSKGGDNSIQTWGAEASASEREEVTATLQAFYDARAAANWAKACTYLAARAKAEFAGFVKGKSGNAACAEAMRGLASQVPQSAFAREARIDYVLSLRIGRRQRLPHLHPHRREQGLRQRVRRRGRAWKVVSVGPTVVY